MKTIKVKNLFRFAEDRLIQKVKRNELDGYSIVDIIDSAYKVRQYLDKHKVLKIPKLTKAEKIKQHRISASKYQESNKDKISLYQRNYRINKR
jgi:hypothetical protein